MSMNEKKFSVWLFRPKAWDGRAPGERVAFPFDEPAEAADQAEAALRQNGEIGQSYCELRFNGDPMPHTVICYLGENRFGIWNTEAVKWPIFYAEAGGSDMLADFPFEIEDDGNSWQEKEDADSKMKSDDEGVMRLDDIEDVDDTEEEEFHDSDEDAEDEAVSEDDEAEDEFATEDEDGDDAHDDEDGEEEGEEEDDSDEDAEDDQDGEQEDTEEDFSGDEEGDEEQEPDLDDDSDNDDEEEEEIEMPRLRIFAKFRGPLGWRKRAEAEELETTNRFALKLGVLDTEAEKTAQQERETFLELVFIESDESRTAGELRLKLPEGIEWSDPTKSGWISATIPYPREDEDDGN